MTTASGPAVPLESEIDADRLRRVYGAFPSGVAAVAAIVDGKPMGLAASSFTSVSIDPPLVSVCMAHTSTTWPVLGQAKRFGLSVLSADQGELCRRLSARTGDRFEGTTWHKTGDGAVLLDGASAWFDCSIYDVIGAGDHDIVLFRVQSHRVHPDPAQAPLVFHASRFRLLSG